MMETGIMGNLNYLIVTAALLGAVVLDLKYRRVDNRFVVSVFGLSLLVQILVHHGPGAWLALGGFAAVTVLCWPLYLLKVFGGGDAKLVMAISPLLDWRLAVLVILTSFFWGAILGLLRVISSGQIKSLSHNMMALAYRRPLEKTQLHAMPYTVALFFGFLTAVSLHSIGWEML